MPDEKQRNRTEDEHTKHQAAPDKVPEWQERTVEAMPEGLKCPASVVIQTGRDVFNDAVPYWAAAIAYYAMLSAFPLLLAVVSIAAYFVEPQWAIGRVTDMLERYVPSGAGFVDKTIREIINARGTTSLISLLILLWTGSRVFGVMARALNVAYDVANRYSVWMRFLVEIGMLLSVGLLFILALASDFLAWLLWDALQVLPGYHGFLYDALRWALPLLLLLAAFFLIYRFVPHGRRHNRSALIGAGAATVLFAIARPLFHTYLQTFAQYNLVYGSLAIVVILIVWTWIVSFITLVGGEVASHVQMMVYERQSQDAVERRHKERTGEARRSHRRAPQPS